MAQALPIAGAAVGGYFGGSMGASAGWLIGSWLMGSQGDEENDIFDTGAEEMPRFNQALRGVTIPILFGTNRVSVQVCWQDNFNVIRNENSAGGGGGKGGGSGMGAKGGGPQTAGTTYNYKLDMLMHLGITDSNMSIYGGWLVAERLDDDTLLAIINNDESNIGFFQSSVERPQNASLTFDEGYFHGGQPTGDLAATNWTHFETIEGGPYRFPYTCLIGFKQLNLGSTSAIPQLSFEIGPGDASVTFNSNALDYWDSQQSFQASGGYGPTGGLFKGEDGDTYQLDGGSGNFAFRVRNVTTQTTLASYSDTDFDADATTHGLDPSTLYDFIDVVGATVLPGKDLILAWGQDTGTVFRSNWAFLLYKVDSLGALVIVGGYQGRSNIIKWPTSNVSVGLYGQGTDDDAILFGNNTTFGATRQFCVYKLPSINEMIIGLIEDGASLNFEDRTHNFATLVTDIDNKLGDHGSYRNYPDNAFCFFLPTFSQGDGWRTKVMWYIGGSDVQWHDDNPAHVNGCQTIYDIIGTHPNGGIFSTQIEEATAQTLTVTDEFVDEAANFLDASEASILPFPDSGFLDDEITVEDASDYDPIPQVQHLLTGPAAGATLLIFWKNAARNSVDRSETGAWTKVRAFIWNPITMVGTQFSDADGAFADPIADWGHTAPDQNDWTCWTISGYYDESAGTLIVGGYASGGAGGALNDLFADQFGTFSLSGVGDVTPPFIIKKILTSQVYGLGHAEAVIDTVSYNAAVAYCEDQAIKVSVQYRREENALKVINDLLMLYGGFLTDSGGIIKFGLQEFSQTTIRTIDNNHLLEKGEGLPPVVVTKGAPQDTYNRVKVNYFDRRLEYRQNFVEVADPVDQDLNGERANEFPAKFVMSEDTALKMANRSLWGNLYARDLFNFGVGPKDSDLEPGSVITLVDSFHEDLRNGKQVRIVHWKERKPDHFDVRAVEEVEYINAATLSIDSVTEASSRTIFGAVAPAADFTMYELPKEFQGANAQLYVGYRQQGSTMGAKLHVSADGVSFTILDDRQPFIISGIMAGALSVRNPGDVDENIEIYLMPDTFGQAFNPASATYAQTFALDDVSAVGRALGAGNIWINSEMMAYEGVNLVGQNHYRFDKLYRGVGGTHIQGHTSGDTFHKHGGGVFNNPYNEDSIGTTVHYKVEPYNFAGLGFNIASVDARTYQIQGTYFRPQVQAPLRTFVQSPFPILTIQSEDLGVIQKKNVIAGGSDVQFEWPDVSRDKGYGSQGYGTGGYGRFTAETSIGWRVEILSKDLTTVVRCTTVDTTAYEYTHLINSEDFTGWAGEFAIRVVPFNEFGVALRDRTKILELFV